MSKLATRSSGVREAIRSREAFDTYGALRGVENDYFGTGILPEPYASQYRQDHPTYTVFSYSTPIAWYTPECGGWVIPDVKYSATTSKHQGVVCVAVG